MNVEPTGSLAARLVIGTVVAGAAVWLVLNSPVFSIRDIRVEGERTLAAEEIIRVGEVVEGDNLITLATDEIAGRIERHPWVEEATVERDLPATVVIRLVERTPRAWVEDPDGPVVLSGDGTILERRARPPESLPSIGEWPDTVAPGDVLDGLTEERRVTAAMRPQLLRRIATAELDDGDVILELRDGGIVLYGTPTDVLAKNRALDGILRWAEGEGITAETVDVRVPSAPSLAPEGGKEITDPIAAA